MISESILILLLSWVVLSNAGTPDFFAVKTTSTENGPLDEDSASDNRTGRGFKAVQLPPYRIAESAPRASREDQVYGDGYNLGYQAGSEGSASYASGSSYSGWGSSYQAPPSYEAPKYESPKYDAPKYEAPKPSYGSYGGGGSYGKSNYESSSYYNPPSYQPSYSSGWGGGSGEDKTLLYALALKYAKLRERYHRDHEAAAAGGGMDVPWGLILAGLPFLMSLASTGSTG